MSDTEVQVDPVEEAEVVETPVEPTDAPEEGGAEVAEPVETPVEVVA